MTFRGNLPLQKKTSLRSYSNSSVNHLAANGVFYPVGSFSCSLVLWVKKTCLYWSKLLFLKECIHLSRGIPVKPLTQIVV